MFNIIFFETLIIDCQHTVISHQKSGHKTNGQCQKQKNNNIFSKITFQFSWKTFPQWILHSSPPYQSRSSAATLDSLR